MRSLIILIALFLGGSTSSQAQLDFYDQLADSAATLVDPDIAYDPSYRILRYPDGDVPADRGVCTDVIIRAYRMFNIDLQKEVHEDMIENFDKYPQIWGLNHPDKNIDHRRVPNLMKFFERHGQVKAHSPSPIAYSPGDIVCWDLGGGITHIGIVVKKKSADHQRHLIIHNIGAGQVIEDILFKYKIIGHYAYGL
jgi:uncharacterized protein YijF (DUF1287 family)